MLKRLKAVGSEETWYFGVGWGYPIGDCGEEEWDKELLEDRSEGR